jgi:aquaporin Z
VNEFFQSEALRNESLRRTARVSSQGSLTLLSSLRFHWPEYLMEVAEFAMFMFCVCAFATVLHHPASPVRHAIASVLMRRAIMGLAVGTTVVAIILTPWGKQSGGHFNPAITFTFFRLGNVAPWDTLFYIVGQFCGAIFGVVIAAFLLRGTPADPAVRYAATMPGPYGTSIAFIAEMVLSAVLMFTILVVSSRGKVARYTPYFVGMLYAIFITFESPLSGMSMNPARSFGPAVNGCYWHALWVYFVAPTLGMLIAAEGFLRARRGAPSFCAKLHHANNKRCIFRHMYRPARVSIQRAKV